MQIKSDYVTPKQLARYLNTSPQKLANDRHLSQGYPYVKDGRRVLYHLPTIEKVLQEKTVYPRNQS